MIKVFLGEDDYEIVRTINRIIDESDLEPEYINSDNIIATDLPTLFFSATLFSDKRLVVIRHLSENKEAWSELPKYLEDLKNSHDNTIILVERKLDKRSNVYKQLKSMADIIESDETVFAKGFNRPKQIQWLKSEAESLGVSLGPDSLNTLLDLVGPDKWILRQSLDKIQLSGDTSVATIKNIIEPSREQNVFSILENAMSGHREEVIDSINTIQLTESPQMFMGLISNQIYCLAALVLSGKPSSEVATDLGVSPYVISNLQSLSKKIDRKTIKNILHQFAISDLKIKTTSIDPWLVIKSLLMKIA
jgi:DNA polymerase III, delta subunit